MPGVSKVGDQSHSRGGCVSEIDTNTSVAMSSVSTHKYVSGSYRCRQQSSASDGRRQQHAPYDGSKSGLAAQTCVNCW